MAVNLPGGELLTGALDIISQSLTIPVLLVLLIIFIKNHIFDSIFLGN